MGTFRSGMGSMMKDREVDAGLLCDDTDGAGGGSPRSDMELSGGAGEMGATAVDAITGGDGKPDTTVEVSVVLGLGRRGLLGAVATGAVLEFGFSGGAMSAELVPGAELLVEGLLADGTDC